jgi:alcohol dehydrogenase (cytochrome c)
LPKRPVVYCPGGLGGVLTPMAEAHNVLYVPWIDLCFKGSATELVRGGPVPPVTGGLGAVDPATGAVIWRHRFGTLDSGAATVANDVFFTSTYDGVVYALSAKNGKVLWSAKLPAGINSFPAVTKTMLIVGAGAITKAHSHDAVVAYSLP